VNAPVPLVERRIESFRGELPELRWTRISNFVRETVSSLNLQTRGTADHFLATVSKYVDWAVRTQGVSQRASEVFTLDLIALFNEKEMRQYSDNYRAQTAQRLHRLASAMSGVAPARERRSVHVAETYTAVDFMHLRGAALAHTMPARCANAHLILGLGAGAGLRTEEVALARVGDVRLDEGQYVVSVRGKYPRVVPVRTEWVSALLRGLGRRAAEEWAFTGYRLPEYPARVVHQFGIDSSGIPTASVTRLRATWIVALLNDAVPVDLVLALAGLASVISLAPYVRAMRPHPLSDHVSNVVGGKS
jgi:integrase